MKQTFFWIILSIVLALYFRIPFWKDLPSEIKRSNQELAETTVRENLAQKVLAVASFPEDMPTDVKNEMVEQQVERLIRSNPAQYQTSISLLKEHLTQGLRNRYSRKYLPEADPYYYLSLTENILEKGSLGESGHNGTFFNPSRLAPAGTWDRMTWHPYVGAIVYRVMSFFKKDISLTTAVSFVPLVLTVLITFALYFLFWTLDIKPFAACLGALIFLLSPIVILRSSYGWYDTDPYILIFSILILSSLFLMLRNPKKSIFFGILGGFLTALFGLFWSGWVYIVPLVGVGILVLIGWHYRKRANEPMILFLKYLVSYCVATLVFALIFLTPESIKWSLLSSFSILIKTSGGDKGVWPNLMLLIGETAKTSLHQWLFLTVSLGAIFFSFLGLFVSGRHFLKTRNNLRFQQWLVIIAICLPLIFLSLQSRRFILFVALPITLLALLGIEWFTHLLIQKMIPKKIKNHRPFWAMLIILICVLPLALSNARKASGESNIVMDDHWFKILNYLRTETPQDAIVFSWWSPGYFISGVAKKRSVVDGGTQHRPENFWIAKGLMSRDEKEAIGIFRMLAASGNEPLNYLQAQGLQTAEAVDLILKIVSRDRDKAYGLLPQPWTQEEKNHLLDLTHKNVSSPVYLLIFNELMESNVVLQLVSRWDFEKAEKIFHGKGQKGEVYVGSDDPVVKYFRKVTLISGDPTSYQKPQPAIYSEGDNLFYENLVIDRVKKQAFVAEQGPSGVEMKPLSLMYRNKGEWIRKPVAEKALPVWAVAFDLDDTTSGRKAMWVREELLNTLLFELYYFEGKSYQWIKPVISTGGLNDTNNVLVYQIDFSAFEKRSAVDPS